ncbi:hypothetical protein HW115_14590 [Verrucomicrobiaceae bacterium N1E253]|uniref:LPS-assembly lipoprotein LptE n=1 Tax=Oceaniferula marina TaxID=2748318 RepID=A0A851GGD4_9BACT|nr:LPS assembly lipoprotein LptE [Oceaniferula marina]NWK56848.1 hypothetical protein [Oceaniferula marina]
MLHRLLLLLLPLALASCTGYHLGGSKPSHLAHVENIQVPLFVNETQLTRADAYATNSAVDALTRDGSYRITNINDAQAVLEGSVVSIDYGQVSSSRTDTLKSEELSMEVTINWILRDASNPARILEKGSSRGKTRFFAGDNLEIAKVNALPDALRRACESMTSRIANGF